MKKSLLLILSLSIIWTAKAQTNNYPYTNLGVSGNATIGGTLTVNGIPVPSSPTGVYSIGTLTFNAAYPAFTAQYSVNSYFQNIIQNSSAGTTASADYIACNDLCTDTTNYADFGRNSSGFTSTGNLTGLAGEGYLYNANGDLGLGTLTANNIHIVTDNSTVDAITVTSTGATTAGSVTIPSLTSGYYELTGTGGLLGNGHIDDGLTTAGTITSSEPETINNSTAPQLTVTGSLSATINLVSSNTGGAARSQGINYYKNTTAEWFFGDNSSNINFLIQDEVNALNMLSLTQNGASVLNSGAGANAIALNGTANSGTGGVTFGSGGSSPSTVASVNGAGMVGSTVNTQKIPTDVTGIVTTTPGATEFTWAAADFNPSTNYSFHCSILFAQATGAGGVGISVQSATNAATRIDAWAKMYTTNPASTTVTATFGSVTNLTSTTATSVASATPGATGTNYQGELDGTIQVGATPGVFNVLIYTGSGSDAVTLKAGSYCSILL